MKKSLSIPPIVQDGDMVLRATAKPVTPEQFGTKELKAILLQMSAALAKEHDGVAIAAPQIGVSLRIFLVSHKIFRNEDGEELDTEDMVVINPEIIKLSKKKKKVPEGCLSVRWYYGNTMRHEKATIRAYDETGKAFTYGGSGLMAQIFQHETDHLNGTLFIDHATDIEKMSDEQVAKMKKEYETHHASK